MPNSPVVQPPAPLLSAFTVQINGQHYAGLVAVQQAVKSIDAMAAMFELDTTNRWPGQPDAWVIQTGDAVTLLIDGVVWATGWVDEVEPEVDTTSAHIKVRGRGRTCDLVDCSAMNSPGRWKGRKLEQIVSDLCKPFGVTVTASADTGAPIAAFALQQGESVKSAIDRLVQQRGLLPIETPTGDLDLASPSSQVGGGALILAGLSPSSPSGLANVIKGSAKHSAQERFSVYVVKGQRQGNDQDNGKTVTQVSAKVTDPQVTRYRPLLIMAEDQATGLSAQARANFAATARAGRAQTGKLTAPSLRDAVGALWSANTLVQVSAPDLGLQGALLINEIKLAETTEDGQTAEVSVIRPEAYSQGEVKGVGLSRLDTRVAGRGTKGRSGRKGGGGPNVAALGDLPS